MCELHTNSSTVTYYLLTTAVVTAVVWEEGQQITYE